MSVFRSEGADRGQPNVPEHQVGADIRGKLCDVNLATLVNGTAPHEHFASLVKSQAPAKRRALRARTECVDFGRQDASGQVRTIADDSEETCHLYPTGRARTRFRMLLKQLRSATNE